MTDLTPFEAREQIREKLPSCCKSEYLKVGRSGSACITPITREVLMTACEDKSSDRKVEQARQHLTTALQSCGEEAAVPRELVILACTDPDAPTEQPVTIPISGDGNAIKKPVKKAA